MNNNYEKLISNNDNNNIITAIDIENLRKAEPNNSYKCDYGCHFDKINKTTKSKEKTETARKKLLFAAIFCVIFMIAEFIGGFVGNSIALMSDALHLLSDCGGLLISLIALWMTQKESTNKLTYGYHRAEIVGALFSVFLIWGLTIWLVYEAIHRLINPQNVNGKIMFIVACFGIIVNIGMGSILHQSHNHNHNHHHHNHNHNHHHNHHHNDNNSQINVRSAFIHALGDLLQSIGVLIASSLIWYDNAKYRIADPICTLIFSVIVIFTTVKIMRDILSVLMESVPSNLDCNEIALSLNELTDVAQVHDLHLWSLSMGKPSLSVHLLLTSSTLDSDGKVVPACADAILRTAQNILSDKFQIHHSTIQIEWPHNNNHCQEKSCPSYCDIIKNKNNNNDIFNSNSINNSISQPQPQPQPQTQPQPQPQTQTQTQPQTQTPAQTELI